MGIDDSKINLLTPGPADLEKKELGKVPLSEGEQPGMADALGAVVGGALGLGGGMSLGTAIASIFVPGVGPVMAIGFAAAGILGAGGAIGGAALGKALETESTHGLPHDELFFYEDALRSGHTVLIAFAEDEREAAQVRNALKDAGAETLDAAREKWWIGLRDAEKIHYEEPGQHSEGRESLYRSGFEAALRPHTRGKPYADAKDELRNIYPDRYDNAVFIRGYERGCEFARQPTSNTGPRRVA
ncbi:MAG TPA: hypothetical protein VJQ50_17555 [Terriglobales bacterium]|nr:hypothetical protein [Terriglobales bacterium]